MNYTIFDEIINFISEHNMIFLNIGLFILYYASIVGIKRHWFIKPIKDDILFSDLMASAIMLLFAVKTIFTTITGNQLEWFEIFNLIVLYNCCITIKTSLNMFINSRRDSKPPKIGKLGYFTPKKE